MLHLRVIVPPELTDTVTELLVREPGVVHVSIDTAAAVDPAGDVLEADVEHAAWVGRRLSRRRAIQELLGRRAARRCGRAPG